MIRRAVLEEPQASRRLERGAQSDHRAPEQFTAARVSFTCTPFRNKVLYCQRFKAGSEAQRDKPKGTLVSEIRIAMLLMMMLVGDVVG